MKAFTLAGLACFILTSGAQAALTYVSVAFDRSEWESEFSALALDTFSVAQAQSDTLNFDSGIVSTAAGAIGSPNHLLNGDRFAGTLRPAGSISDGYLSFTWTFPTPVTGFGADFFSIAGTRQVSVRGTFDSGLQAYDLRSIFIDDGGLDQGFFGIVSSTPFSSIELVALGSSTSFSYIPTWATSGLV
jgi:hypothetical protein